jgi:ribonuclease VapC
MGLAHVSAAVVDTSAWISIAFGESDASIFIRAIANLDRVLVSSVTRVELGIVGLSRGPLMAEKINQLLAVYAAQLIPFDESMALGAVEAAATYGKGRHKAALNFGDCCAYALAKSMSLPLLYKGEDFVHTDIRSALA